MPLQGIHINPVQAEKSKTGDSTAHKGTASPCVCQYKDPAKHTGLENHHHSKDRSRRVKKATLRESNKATALANA